MKLYSDHPHSDEFFADSFGGVTSESLLAEREGFEPSKRFRRLHAFQACLFSHSSISPYESVLLVISCYVCLFFPTRCLSK